MNNSVSNYPSDSDLFTVQSYSHFTPNQPEKLFTGLFTGISGGFMSKKSSLLAAGILSAGHYTYHHADMKNHFFPTAIFALGANFWQNRLFGRSAAAAGLFGSLAWTFGA